MILFTFFFLIACSSSKSLQGSQEELSIDGIGIGKEQTAVLGKIVSTRTAAEMIFLKLEVETAKQGGAQAQLLTAGSQIEVVFSKIFQRVYLEKNAAEVISILEPAERVLLLISLDIKDNINQVDYIKK